MICYLKGNILQKYPDFIILDVNGVGYEVFMPASALGLLPAGGQADLYIFTYVREDTFRLYGFCTMFDKNVFEMLLSVSGIGPKVAVGLLGFTNALELCDLIIENDTSRLTNIPGIGTKTAERLALELKTKAQKLIARFREQELFENSQETPFCSIQNNRSAQAHSMLKDLNSALLNMGYKEKQFAQLMANLQKRLQLGEILVFEDILKDSLKKLSERILKG